MVAALGALGLLYSYAALFMGMVGVWNMDRAKDDGFWETALIVFSVNFVSVVAVSAVGYSAWLLLNFLLTPA